MKRIGAGWQYIVYDLGNGRVLKRPRPRYEQIPFVAVGLLGIRPRALLDLPRELRRIDRETEESAELIRRTLPHMDVSLLGHPTFVDHVSFEQDKAEPLGRYFRRVSVEEKLEALRGYAALTERLWSYGIGEVVFNFTLNNGHIEGGAIIQLDLGEFTSSKERMLSAIKRQSWRTQFSFLSLEPALQTPAAAILAPMLSAENLERCWGKTG